uniref:ATP synthase complex subunit 8 n=1 Tax=Laxta sp. BLA048 TaxID=2093470 RepID=A0A2P1H946_9NEOP|nr:ATP synthase F0 subunit 8 [Laxta sp. BLA048]
MPQMMPLSWLTLYIYFILIFFLFLIINYYSLINYPIFMKNKTSIKSMYWKW